MKKLSLLPLLLICMMVRSQELMVKNIAELEKAQKNAKPGDVIVLQNGIWKDVKIQLTAAGTAAKPISFRAQSAGQVIISGESMLRIGGSNLIIDGLLFTNGYSGSNAVIDFRAAKDQVANNCRVTNSAIMNFNNPKRMDENYWVSFSGKNNRLDHCSFQGKTNMGVLLAVILDDDRSRENFHSIDHNYFGARVPLASNSGEIIRVGVSQHCQFNSNTQIIDNFFEYCDGETEIVSIKSCSNVVRNNLFRECQGGVVLRHGNFNTVENNIFLGNDKPGTGGVRIINQGQWVVNNLFYKCRGIDFRSPMSLMNGIPNSPANRYVQVTDAVVANNSFFNCSSVSFGEGSDTERTLPPQKVMFINNIFYNTKDSLIYRAFDDIHGISFASNITSREVPQPLGMGFQNKAITVQQYQNIQLPNANTNNKPSDSLQEVALKRLGRKLPSTAGFGDIALVKSIMANSKTCGAAWFESYKHPIAAKPVVVTCYTAEDVYKQLERDEPVIINLALRIYDFTRPMIIKKDVKIASVVTTRFNTPAMDALFVIQGHGKLTLSFNFDGSGIHASYFIMNDAAGSSDHYNLVIEKSDIKSLDRANGCHSFFFANKYMVADSIVVRSSTFSNNNIDGFIMTDETDNKGYYSAEKIRLVDNTFNNLNGKLIDVYRGGNDESTMGPDVLITLNKINNARVPGNQPFIKFSGVQASRIEYNKFENANSSSDLIYYQDWVRAHHYLINNKMKNSGMIHENKFLQQSNNKIN